MTLINNLSDEQLLMLLKKDDQQAFSEIYKRYAESLAGFAGSKLYNLDDEKDILHDLFVKVWEERHTLVITGNLKAYLFAALRYRIIDRIRKNVTREEYAREFQSLANNLHEHGIDKDLEAKETKLLVEKSLQELPAKTQQIYRLSRHEHRSVSEISRLMSLSEQTVKNQLTIALKHLRRSITFTGLVALLNHFLK